MNKYYIETDSCIFEGFFENKFEAIEHYENNGIKVTEVYDATISHLCKYCCDIVQGTNEDELCDDCKEMFGHYLYSQL